jgi:hypothetical protein
MFSCRCAQRFERALRTLMVTCVRTLVVCGCVPVDVSPVVFSVTG